MMSEGSFVSKSKSSIQTGLVVLLGTGLLSYQWWSSAHAEVGSFGTRLGYWWQSGVLIDLMIPLAGYAVMQLLAGGNLTPSALFESTTWLAIVPFVILGGLCSTAYGSASAVGWIGEGTIRSTRVVEHEVRDVGSGSPTYYLLVQDLGGEWVLRNGEVMRDVSGVPVNSDQFAAYSTGTPVQVAENPSSPYDELVLPADLESKARSAARWALLWALASFGSLVLVRGRLVRLG